MIDLRSDTVTRPTPGMKAAMSAAELGDDVFREDPSVNNLEERVAALLGKEAALFVPSGTMSNQIAIKVHTRPCDEMICDTNCHIHNYECGGAAALSGVTTRTIDGEHGVFDVAHLEGKVRPNNDHLVRTRMVCLENTHNRGGGRIFPLEKVRAIRAWAKRHNLIHHLDGARLWNAIVATGVPAATWAAEFDTVSVCFSKGLGAPVGSALIGPKEFIAQARRIRKLFGGGMRQAGVLAAAALYAVENHVERLAEDHRNAQVIAEAVAETPGLSLQSEVQTNLIFIEVDPAVGTAAEVSGKMKELGVLALPTAPQTIRACTHLDVSKAQAERAAAAIHQAVPKRAAVSV